MASPFKFFRTHQTQLLVVIGLLTMVAFIILPSVLQQLEVVGRSRAAANVVETKKYGPLSNDEISRLRYNNRVLSSFFSRLFSVYNSPDVKVSDEVKLTARRMAEHFETVASRSSKKDLVMYWLLENKAKEMGLSINDSYISSFIADFTKGLDEKSIDLALYGKPEDQKNNKKKTEDELFGAISSFLLCENARMIMSSPVYNLTTGIRVESFNRLNQFADVEIYPVKVKDYVSQAKEPSETEIKVFFEQYKDKVYDIHSSEPGLRQPQKATLEYCYGSYTAFMKLETITDEQVQKTYEENKERFVNEKYDEKQENASLLNKYLPLDDDLKQKIRESLARPAAEKELEEAINTVQNAMDEYSKAKKIADTDETVSAPEKLDLAALAKQNNLSYEKKELLSRQDFEATDLAKLHDGTYYATSEFYGNTPMFQTRVYSDYKDGTPVTYAIWKIEDVAEHTPTLEDKGIKQSVIEQFKYQEARKLAEKDAKALTEKAIASQKPTPLPLAQCLGDKAFSPAKFTWMTLRPIFEQTMRIPYFRAIQSAIDEKVEDVGFDFMSTLFQMKAGDIKPIVNSSESTFYIVKMNGLTPVNQLFNTFCIMPEREFTSAYNVDIEYFQNDLFESLEKEAGLKWVDQPNREAEMAEY